MGRESGGPPHPRAGCGRVPVATGLGPARWSGERPHVGVRAAVPTGLGPAPRSGAQPAAAPPVPVRRGHRPHVGPTQPAPTVDDAVKAVARVPQARDDVGLVVEALVDGGDHHGDIGAVADGLLQGLDALGGRQDAHAGHVACPPLEEVVRGGHHRVPGGEHRVQHVALAARQVIGQAVGVGLDLQGVVIAAHAQEPDLGGGQQTGHALEHAQARAQHGNDDRPGLGELAPDGGRDGGVDRGLGDRHLARRLVGQQRDEFVHQLPESGGRGLAVAQNGEFVGDERMVGNVNAHGSRLPHST